MHDCAYIFLDEGGNFDFSPKGTKYFLLTSISTKRPFAAHSELDNLKHDCIEMGLDVEYFHCAEDNPHIRKQVFSIIQSSLNNLRIDSIIVEKSKTNPALRIEEKFYPQVLGYLLRYVIERELKGNPKEIIVITDSIPIKKKRNAIEKSVKKVLKNMLPKGCPYRILHHDSKSHMGLQIVDYCNWAIFRKWQKEETWYYDMLSGALKSEYEIFKTGTTRYY